MGGRIHIIDTEQVIAERRDQVGSEKKGKAQVESQLKSNAHQYRIENDYGDRLDNAPLATMRTPLGDGLCNRTCSSTCHFGSPCLPCLRGLIY